MPKKTAKKSTRKVASRSTARSPKRATQDFSAALKSAQMSPASTSSSNTLSTEETTFSQLAMMVVAFSVVSLIVLYIANMLFPSNVVLGNHIVTPMMALLMSSIVISLLGVGATPLIEWASKAINLKLNASHWMLLYLVINTLVVWLVARFAEILGLGVSSWVVALGLGFILDVAQGLLVKMIFTPAHSE
jgi:hypothetical protein